MFRLKNTTNPRDDKFAHSKEHERYTFRLTYTQKCQLAFKNHNHEILA